MDWDGAGRQPGSSPSLRAPDANLAVASRDIQVAGFGLMQYQDDEAHLILLAVDADCRRAGIGARAGGMAGTLRPHGRHRHRLPRGAASNLAARAFYRSLGYREVDRIPGYYQGQEDGVRIAKDLWLQPPGTGA